MGGAGARPGPRVREPGQSQPRPGVDGGSPEGPQLLQLALRSSGEYQQLRHTGREGFVPKAQNWASGTRCRAQAHTYWLVLAELFTLRFCMLEFSCRKKGDRLSHQAAQTARGTEHCRPPLQRGAEQRGAPRAAGRGHLRGTPGTAAAIAPQRHLACRPSEDAGEHPSPLPRAMEMLIHPAGAEKSSCRWEAPACTPPRSRAEATGGRL